MRSLLRTQFTKYVLLLALSHICAAIFCALTSCPVRTLERIFSSIKLGSDTNPASHHLSPTVFPFSRPRPHPSNRIFLSFFLSNHVIHQSPPGPLAKCAKCRPTVTYVFSFFFHRQFLHPTPRCRLMLARRPLIRLAHPIQNLLLF